MPPDAPSTPKRVVLFVGGDEFDLAPALDHIGGDDLVIAVDSGLHQIQDLGIHAHHVVGDMDSVGPRQLAQAEGDGAVIHVHHPDKDATDLELAVDLALELLRPEVGAATPALHVVGGGGGRLDHLVGDLAILATPRLAPLDVTARFGVARVAVARPGRTCSFAGHPGDHVSLLPFHGDAVGVTTEGLRWPLVAAHLAAGTSRALSNELVDTAGAVQVEQGTVVVVQPGTRGRPMPPRPGPYDPSPGPGAAPIPGLGASPTAPGRPVRSTPPDPSPSTPSQEDPS